MEGSTSRFSENLTSILEFTSLGCLALMAILVIAQVILRYVFNAPLTWSEELARILFIYLTFMGIGAAYGRRRHMFVDSLITIIPSRIRRGLESSVVAGASIFLLVILVVTAQSMIELVRSEITTPALEISMALIYLVIPLGFSAFIMQMWLLLLKKRKG